ncbi:MAG: VOC family protein [Chloroflexi bacterium]|nr:VOC family protein [Chloroflexota bacterium]
MPVGTKNQVIPGCGTHHVAIQTRDWEASLALYQDTLGMSKVAEFGSPERKIVLLDIGDGSHIELFAPPPETTGGDAAAPGEDQGIVKHVALATTDARRAIEHVRRAGYEVTIEPGDADLGGMPVTYAFFKGPNGEIIEFFQNR